MSNKLFTCNSYVDFLKHRIADCRHTRGYQSRLAEAASCQRSYFSQVLQGCRHLTPEHAAGIVDYLRLSDLECEYFMALVDLARASTRSLHRLIERRLVNLRKSYSDLSQRTKSKTIGMEAGLHYYSSWYWMAIHMCLAVDGLQEPKQIALRLGLSQETVEQCLVNLEQFGLIDRVKGGWHFNTQELHLPNLSPLTRINHANWRERALTDIDRQTSGSLHYTSVFALSHVDAQHLKNEVSDVIIKFRNEISSSPSQEVYAFLLDWFPV